MNRILAILLACFPASAATIINNQAISVPVGTQQLAAVNVTDGVNTVTASLARDTSGTPTLWTSASTTVQLDVEISFDGGSTWKYAFGCGSKGGILLDRGGGQSTATTVTYVIPAAAGRKMRATFTVAGSTLTSTLTVTVT